MMKLILILLAAFMTAYTYSVLTHRQVAAPTKIYHQTKTWNV